MADSLERLASLFVLIPAAIGMRGNIFGALGSRLGTGTPCRPARSPRASARASSDRTSIVGRTCTLATSLFLGGAARVGRRRVRRSQSISIWDFVVDLDPGRRARLDRRGDRVGLRSRAGPTAARWDLDSVSAPLVTAIGDIGDAPRTVGRVLPGADPIRHARDRRSSPPRSGARRHDPRDRDGPRARPADRPRIDARPVPRRHRRHAWPARSWRRGSSASSRSPRSSYSSPRSWRTPTRSRGSSPRASPQAPPRR